MEKLKKSNVLPYRNSYCYGNNGNTGFIALPALKKAKAQALKSKAHQNGIPASTESMVKTTPAGMYRFMNYQE